MELVALLLILLYGLLAMFYGYVLPTLINFALSYYISSYFCRNSEKFWWVFILVSLLLTFGTRLPDFLADSVEAFQEVAHVKKPIELDYSSSLNLQMDTRTLVSRSNYFEASGLKSVTGAVGFGKRWAHSYYVFPSQIAPGVSFNKGEPNPEHPTLRLVSGNTETHTSIQLTLTSEGQIVSEYRKRIRTSFRDEVGASKLRHHLLHLMKNTIWNGIAKVISEAIHRTPNDFLGRAIVHSPTVESSVSLSRNTGQSNENVILKTPIVRPRSASNSQIFDCRREHSIEISTFYLGASIVSPTFEKNMVLSKGAIPDDLRRGHGFSRVVCGADGYAALITIRGAPGRIVLFDSAWQELQVFEVDLPSNDAVEGHRMVLHSFYQSEGELVVRYWVWPKGSRRALSSRPVTEEKVLKVAHPALGADYGSLGSQNHRS